MFIYIYIYIYEEPTHAPLRVAGNLPHASCVRYIKDRCMLCDMSKIDACKRPTRDQ